MSSSISIVLQFNSAERCESIVEVLFNVDDFAQLIVLFNV